jgi:hypothetical protein
MVCITVCRIFNRHNTRMNNFVEAMLMIKLADHCFHVMLQENVIIPRGPYIDIKWAVKVKNMIKIHRTTDFTIVLIGKIVIVNECRWIYPFSFCALVSVGVEKKILRSLSYSNQCGANALGYWLLYHSSFNAEMLVVN